MKNRSEDGNAKPLLVSQSLGYHVRQLSESWSHALHARLNAQGIAVGAWRYLRELFHQDGLTNTELSERVGRRGPTTVAALRSLESAGFIAIVPHPDDQRMRLVNLTERGATLWKRAAPVLDTAEAIALRGVSPEELALFRTVILKIQRNLDAADHRRHPWQRRRTEELAEGPATLSLEIRPEAETDVPE